MSTSTLLIVGYGLGVVGVLYFALDSGRIPGRVWFWSGATRPGWWTAFLALLIAGGFPAFVAAVVWNRSATRRNLLSEIGVGPTNAHRLESLRRSTSGVA